MRIGTLLLLAGVIFALQPSAFAAEGSELQVGIASVDVTPEIGVPLGGFGGGARRIIPFDIFNKYKYSFYLKPSVGINDPIRAKAMVLKRGDRRLLFMSLDVVGVTAAIYRDLLTRIKPMGFAEGDVFISGTHTHSGPGTLSSEWVWETLAMDHFQPKIYERFVAGILRAVSEASSAAEPAELFNVHFTADGIQHNRRGRPGHFDPEAQALVAMANRGVWLGGMANLPVHGTALGMDNHKFSADVLGGIERALETRFEQLNGSLKGLEYSANRTSDTLPTVLFMNGAEGDVAPAEGGLAGIASLGDRFAEQAMAALPNARRIDSDWSIRKGHVRLGKAGFHLIGCVKNKMRKFVNKVITIGLGNKLPKEADFWLLKFGDLSMMTWPGEPTTSIGLELKQMAHDSGAQNAWVLGLTNGYLSYFTTPEEFRAGGYEACSSLYGASGGTNILSAYRDLFATN